MADTVRTTRRRSMALPLIVLAIGSIVAGYVGVPHALGGSNRIESFLEPCFEAHRRAARRSRRRPRRRRRTAAGGSRGPCRGRDARRRRHRADADGALERRRARRHRHRGVLLAAQPQRRRPDGAVVRRPSTGCCSTSTTSTSSTTPSFVQPIKLLSTVVLWRGVDAGLIDGAVNGVGAVVSGSSSVLRRLQTGSVRTYAVRAVRRSGGDPRLLPAQINDAAFTDRFSSARRRDAGAPRRRARRPARARAAGAQPRAADLARDLRRDALLWWRFDPASAAFQFEEKHAWIPEFGIQYHLGVDGISLFLIVLTGFLTPLALLSSWESVHKSVKLFSFFILALETAMLGVFVSIDLFLFYIFWDAMLIPMYFLIGIWGYERRIYAAVKFILYTMAGSVLMLIAIIGLAVAHAAATGSPSFNLLDLYGAALSSDAFQWFVPRLRAGLRDQGAAVPVPHLAARRARRGADRRLGHPGRRAAEDGHLRAAALRVPALPGRRRSTSRPTSRRSRSSASSTARWSRWSSRT